MFVTTFRYRVRPEKLGDYLDVQRRASEIYAQLVPNPPLYLQSANDPCQWLELHWYTDDMAYRLIRNQLSQHPDIPALWQAFQETLDHTFPGFLEEFREPTSSHLHHGHAKSSDALTEPPL